jgi:predicted RNA-binding protein associated with RNAse of E/G family
VRIVDRGYDWLQHFPDGAHYVLLAAFDQNGELVQWYIDICGQVGLDERGIPCYQDLYLDIVISPAGETLLLDVDELDEALRQGEVTAAEYNFAWREASTLLTALEEDMVSLLWLSETHYMLLKSEIDRLT